MLDQPVSMFTNKKMVTIDTGLTVQDTAKTMVEADVDSILVFTNYNVIGIVTIRDMLTEIVAKGKDPSKVEIGELARRQIIKIKKDAKVKEAIELMRKNNIRRLVVWDDERPIGTISQKMIIGNMGKSAVTLPELEIPDRILCPYCLSVFADKTLLSKHINDIHIGKGILGNKIPQAQKLGSV